MFDHPLTESKSNRVEIKDVDANVLEAMLRYIYSGQVKQNNKNKGVEFSLLGTYDFS